MQAGGAGFELLGQGDAFVLRAAGRWLVAAAAELDPALRKLDGIGAGASVRIDLAGVEMIDTAGAWLVLRTRRAFEGRGIAASIENLSPAFAPLFEQVAKGGGPEPTPTPPRGLTGALRDALQFVGEGTVDFIIVARDLIGTFGLVSVTLAHTLRHPGRLRYVALVAQMQRAGVTALPIVGLLSFLIGVVIAFQGADQLRQFGAEIFTVNLLGIGILRELGVLMTAIIVAGRSGSAFTAEIGAMQVNQELDALRTLGLDPVEVLVLPRLIGLVLTLPLLAVYADFMGLFGGAVMCWNTLEITPLSFIRQLHDAIGEWTFWVGIIKAPFFAVTIALVGCHAGFRVSGSAESVGRLTTVSVVQSIFLVIIIDAAFSILFTRLGI